MKLIVTKINHPQVLIGIKIINHLNTIMFSQQYFKTPPSELEFPHLITTKVKVPQAFQVLNRFQVPNLVIGQIELNQLVTHLHLLNVFDEVMLQGQVLNVRIVLDAFHVHHVLEC